MRKKIRNAILALTLSAGLLTGANVDAAKPITIEEQGSFTVGGAIVKYSGTFSQKNFFVACEFA